ncbi:MAG: hypothetical protein VXX31_15240 [Planctomycetota bacterium]|nr:hypothetical protein [Planctomycetota bacterium]
MNKPTLDALPTYQHTQRGPWSFVLLAVVASNLTLAVRLWGNEPAWASWLFLSVALLMTFMTFCFQSLTTTVSETSLRVHFGPIPLLEKKVLLEEIVSVRPEKSSLLDGWGVHWTPGKGWIYNMWGFDCLAINLGTRHFRVGTNDPEQLCEVLERAISALKQKTVD